MRKYIAILACITAAFVFTGCSNNSVDETPPKPSGTINNSAPGAATAGAAAPATDTPTPGEMKLGGKRMTKGGGAPPPPVNNN